MADSGCPVSFSGLAFDSAVAPGDRAAAADRIVDATVTVVASDFACTDVVSLQEAQAGGLLSGGDVEDYRAVVEGLVGAGSTLVRLDWLRTADGTPFSTLAVADPSTSTLVYDPLISSWNNPAQHWASRIPRRWTGGRGRPETSSPGPGGLGTPRGPPSRELRTMQG